MLFPNLPNQTVALFPLFMGTLAILFAVWHKPLQRLFRQKPARDVFTNPRFRRSALINEQLGRGFLLLIGISFLIQGVGPLFLSADATATLAVAALVIAVLVALAIIGVILFNWKA